MQHAPATRQPKSWPRPQPQLDRKAASDHHWMPAALRGQVVTICVLATHAHSHRSGPDHRQYQSRQAPHHVQTGVLQGS
eukprot:11273294-Karenia_brevis.AAC.1